MKKPLSLRKRPSGQTLAEFAMVSSIFLLLVFGIIEMAIVVYQYTTISMAAREAVRYAAVHSPTSANPATTAQIQAVATNEATFLTASEVTVSFPADPNADAAGQDDAQVSISHAYSLYIPVLDYFVSATDPLTMTLTSSSQMLVSQ